MDNLEEMDKFLETYSPPKLNQEEIDNLNRPITRSEIKSVIKQTNKQKKPPCKQRSRTRQLHWGILPNIKRTYRDPSQTLPKDCREGNIPKVIL